MGKSIGSIELDSITQEQVEQFFQFLQGEVPQKLETKNSIKLSEGQAFSVIYYLQEILGVLPDKFERCKECGSIYDSDMEGNAEGYCDVCRKD